jgi:hypothetical protein
MLFKYTYFVNSVLENAKQITLDYGGVAGEGNFKL